MRELFDIPFAFSHPKDREKIKFPLYGTKKS